MSETVSLWGVGVQDAVVVAVSLAGFVLVVPVQIASMILFDVTGLDAVVPTVVFMSLLPAIAVGLVPFAVVARTYGRGSALGAVGGLVVAYAAFGVYSIQFYTL